MLGGGHMGRALLGGLVRHAARPADLCVGEASAAARALLEREIGVRAFPDNGAAIREAEVIILAVKPQDAAGVLRPLAPELRARPVLLVSVAAGIEIRSLEAWCGESVPIVRAMPNRGALVGAGATGLYAAPRASALQRGLAEQIMRSVGTVVWVPAERDLDVVTALSGSGPAYFFLLADLMAQSAVRLGLTPQAARQLAVATLHGAGALAQASDAELAQLAAEIASKGGTTEAAMRELTGPRGIGNSVARALDAATQRGRELAAQFGAGA
jgi:pyrroline-5-carboxylate reductase